MPSWRMLSVGSSSDWLSMVCDAKVDLVAKGPTGWSVCFRLFTFT